MRKVLILFSLVVISICLVLAADFTPQGNINLRDIYNITGAPYVNATIYYGNGSQLTGLELESVQFDASTTINITCFNSPTCNWYMNATDSCQYYPSGGKDCGA